MYRKASYLIRLTWHISSSTLFAPPHQSKAVISTRITVNNYLGKLEVKGWEFRNLTEIPYHARPSL
ncbi:exported hypothetical protein [Vibrio chagasii]|nr:exported hypothetical protein [Vibrio chagasii]CAH6945357.1 exported hypothetical protein [Vibrio chagasii]CAH6983179.1 exported hypothetical protein [Vibrio chagasii]CAH7041173.1 exported hypothetical protein [Vibrio chagasii]CAH7277796.1 exported hypothetical protein [Vibrio chagasii]